jgi:DNA-binding SARP family transcriptional activator
LRALVEEDRTRAPEATALTGLAAQLANQQLTLQALAAMISYRRDAPGISARAVVRLRASAAVASRRYAG